MYAGTRAARSAETGSAAVVGGAVPQRETRLGVCEGGGVVAVLDRPGAVPGGEHDGGAVDLVLAEREPVPGGGAGDQLGAELGTGP